MKIIKGDLVLKKNTIINDDVKVEGNVRCKGGCWDLNCLDLICWDLNCRDLNCLDLICWDLNCRDLDCWNLICRDLDCRDLDCRDLICRDLDCRDLDFYAVAITYNSFKCKRWKAERDNYVIKCLDGEIELKEKEK